VNRRSKRAALRTNLIFHITTAEEFKFILSAALLDVTSDSNLRRGYHALLKFLSCDWKQFCAFRKKPRQAPGSFRFGRYFIPRENRLLTVQSQHCKLSLELAPCPVGQFGQNAQSLGVTTQRFRYTATQMQPISITQLLQPYYPNSIVMPSTAGHLPPRQFAASTSALA
jgi:hypothetical protein